MFSDALAQTLLFEGGYVNDARDPGGETNKGITHAVYDSYRTLKKLPIQSVKDISHDELVEIYQKSYWNPAKCEIIANTHPKLATIHFDTAVNCGTGTAARCLQRALNVMIVDGIIGPDTINALNYIEDNLAVQLYAVHRMKYYADICLKNPTLQAFLYNWTMRVRTLLRNLYDGKTG